MGYLNFEYYFYLYLCYRFDRDQNLQIKMIPWNGTYFQTK